MEEYGDWFTHDKTSRAKIFGREEKKVIVRVISVMINKKKFSFMLTMYHVPISNYILGKRCEEYDEADEV